MITILAGLLVSNFNTVKLSFVCCDGLSSWIPPRVRLYTMYSCPKLPSCRFPYTYLGLGAYHCPGSSKRADYAASAPHLLKVKIYPCKTAAVPLSVSIPTRRVIDRYAMDNERASDGCVFFHSLFFGLFSGLLDSCPPDRVGDMGAFLYS